MAGDDLRGAGAGGGISRRGLDRASAPGPFGIVGNLLPGERVVALIGFMKEKVSEILGPWRIVEMEGDDPNEEDGGVPAFIRFDPDHRGEFAFGCVEGAVDHRLLEREGKPGVEWTWEGNDERDHVSGRGWAVLDWDGLLKGMFFFHQGTETDFVAKRVGAQKSGASGIGGAPLATARQGQFLAFIHTYTKLNGRPPSEADMQRHFQVSPPSVHDMILMLEKKGFIERTPRAARSIRLLVPPERLPELE